MLGEFKHLSEDGVQGDFDVSVLNDDFQKELSPDKPKSPETVTFKHFWKLLEKGYPNVPYFHSYDELMEYKEEHGEVPPYVPKIPKEEIAELVDKLLGQYEPMTKLSPEELTSIRSVFIEAMMLSANSLEGVLKGVLVINDKKYRVVPAKNDLQREVYEEHQGIGLLNYEEFRRLLISDPDIWHTAKVIDGGQTPFTLQGIRGLDRSKEYYQTAFGKIRERTGREKLNILDVGGASGRWSADVKKLDPNTETFNITLHEEPVIYPVDHNYLIPAELMPKELKERMDFIHSNISFRYYLFPDIALINVVKALAPGGRAEIDFGTEKSPLWMHEDGADLIRTRLTAVINWIKDLESQGIIESNMPSLEEVKDEFEDLIHLHFDLVIKKRLSLN